MKQVDNIDLTMYVNGNIQALIAISKLYNKAEFYKDKKTEKKILELVNKNKEN